MTTKTAKKLSGKARVKKAAAHAHAKVIANNSDQPSPEDLEAALMDSGMFGDIDGDDDDGSDGDV